MSKKKSAEKQASKNTSAGNASPGQPSKRQTLTKQTRDAATALQSATRPGDSEPAYDVPDIQKTPDENNPKFKNYAASFHKLFEHDTTTGLLTPSGVTSYENFLKGLNNPPNDPNSDFNQNALNSITLADPGMDVPPRVLINPQSSKSLTIKGGDVAAYRFKSQPITDKRWEIGYKVVYAQGEADTNSLLQELSFASGYSAAEMVEVYAMALLRDLDFDAYNVPNPDVQLALDALNAFGEEFRGPKEKQGSNYRVTTKTLFRGNSPESLRGGYLSKFLLLRRPPLFAAGCAPGTADIINAGIFFGELSEALTAPQPNPGREFSLTWNDYVAIQNRRIPQKYQPGDFKGRVVISNGRNLAGLVHVDSLYQEHAFAVDVLTGGNYPRTPVSPYTPPKAGGIHAKNEGDGPTLGPPDAAGLVGAVALEAARLAWSQKYLIARRARPEVFGALVHKRKTGGGENTYGPIDARLLTNDAVRKLLERVKEENAGRGGPNAATYLLSQVFPESAPAHPAWPSGHATVAGACVTVIKAIFDDRAQVLQQIDCNPSPACPNANANPHVDPPPFTDEDGNPLTVGGELDKLASNIALGRNFGGVHFRSDGEHGILLGERAAIRFLRDHLRTYRERFRCDTSPGGTDPCFEFSMRNGRRIKITADGVSAVEETEEAAARPAPEKRTDRTHV
jgi:membrane-associated phospholipid phosphatase